MFAAVSECVIELEPMVRTFDEIDFLEAVLEIKRAKVSLCFLKVPPMFSAQWLHLLVLQ